MKRDGSTVYIQHEPILVERGDYRLTFLDDGEGLDGRYDPNDPLDIPCMRFFIEERIENEWVTIENTSYCTRVCTQLPRNELTFAARWLLKRFVFAFTHSGASAKQSAAGLSWTSTADLQREFRHAVVNAHAARYGWDDTCVISYLVDFIANRGLLRSLGNYLDDIGQEQQADAGVEGVVSRPSLPVPCGGEQYYEVQLRRRLQQTATVIVLAPTDMTYARIAELAWKNEVGDAGWQDNHEAGAEPDDHIVLPMSAEAVRTVKDVYGRICEDGHFERSFTE